MTTFAQILKEFIITKNKQNPSIRIKAKKFLDDPAHKGYELLLSDINKWLRTIKSRMPFLAKEWHFEIHDTDQKKFVPIEWHDLLKRYRLVVSK
jgi:hypothetical protein